MTAKHRKSKNNHKHEENFFKNDVVESEVRTGASSSSVHLGLFLVIVIGGAVGLWFCFQQHQTLSQLTDSVAGMQGKIMKLQAAHEEFRQSGTKVSFVKSPYPHPHGICWLLLWRNASHNKETVHESDYLKVGEELRASIRFQNAKSFPEDDFYPPAAQDSPSQGHPYLGYCCRVTGLNPAELLDSAFQVFLKSV